MGSLDMSQNQNGISSRFFKLFFKPKFLLHDRAPDLKVAKPHLIVNCQLNTFGGVSALLSGFSFSKSFSMSTSSVSLSSLTSGAVTAAAAADDGLFLPLLRLSEAAEVTAEVAAAVKVTPNVEATAAAAALPSLLPLFLALPGAAGHKW